MGFKFWFQEWRIPRLAAPPHFRPTQFSLIRSIDKKKPTKKTSAAFFATLLHWQARVCCITCAIDLPYTQNGHINVVMSLYGHHDPSKEWMGTKTKNKPKKRTNQTDQKVRMQPWFKTATQKPFRRVDFLLQRSMGTLGKNDFQYKYGDCLFAF